MPLKKKKKKKKKKKLVKGNGQTIIPVLNPLPDLEDLYSYGIQSYQSTDNTTLYVLPAESFLPPEVIEEALALECRFIALGRRSVHYFTARPAHSWYAGSAGKWPFSAYTSVAYIHNSAATEEAVRAVSVFQIMGEPADWWKYRGLSELEMSYN